MGISKSPARVRDVEKGPDLVSERSSSADENASDSSDKIQMHNMHWSRATITLIAETVSMGILSLPHAAGTMGMIPAVLLNLLIASLSTYTGITLWRVQMRHPEVASYADFPKILFGRWGGWLGGVSLAIVLLLIMAAHLIAGEAMLSTVTNQGACAVWFSLATMGAAILLTLPRMFKANFWVSLLACISITAATIFTMVSVASSHQHALSYKLFVPSHQLSLVGVAQGISCITLSYMGHVAYASIVREMENPEDFPKALYTAQGSTSVLYITVTIVIYYFAGADVKAIAVESASTMRDRSIAWYMAIPTILGAGVILALVLSKTIYQAFWTWRGDADVVREKSLRAKFSWFVIVVLGWVTAWMLSQIITSFTAILSLIGAIFGSWISFGVPGLLWFGTPFDTGSHRKLTTDLSDSKWSHQAVTGSAYEVALPSKETHVVHEAKSSNEVSTSDRTESQIPENEVRSDSDRSLVSSEESIDGATILYWRCAWDKTRKRPLVAALNILLVLVCLTVMALGMYGAISDLKDNPDNRKPFPCVSSTANLTSMA